MEFLKECSQSELADKSHVKALMGMLTTCEFDGTHIICQHVTKMIDIAAKLGSMGMEVSESLLVQFNISSLPPEFGPFQINYNTIKDKWSTTKLQTMLIQEEARLKKQGTHLIKFMSRKGDEKKPERKIIVRVKKKHQS